MTIKKPVVTAFLLLFLAVPAAAQDNAEWIVIGSDAASAVQSAISARFGVDQGPRFQVTEQDNGLSVVRIDPQTEPVIHGVMHSNFRRCGGYTVHPSEEAALAEKNNPIYQPGYIFPEGVFPQQLTEQARVNPALQRVNAARILSTIGDLQDLGTRYYQSAKGQQAADMIEELWRGYGQGRTDFSVERVGHSWLQDSVVATLRGADLPDEIVVIGGHLDSINGADTNDAPGADDNASGVAVVSEVLKVLVDNDFRPKRTIRFMAYAAEEVGLRGSGDIATGYGQDGKTVNGVLQLDMTGYAGSPEDLYFVTDFVNPNATDFLKRLIAEYNTGGAHAITWGETRCGYACSDHASWTRNGFPAAFPFEAKFSDYNQAIHSPNDDIAHLDGTGAHQARFAKLGVEFAMEMAKSAGTAPRPNRYLYSTLRVISGSAPRGCGASDWACMTALCKADLGSDAWRGWAGCWRDGSSYQCYFECGRVTEFK